MEVYGHSRLSTSDRRTFPHKVGAGDIVWYIFVRFRGGPARDALVPRETSCDPERREQGRGKEGLGCVYHAGDGRSAACSRVPVHPQTFRSKRHQTRSNPYEIPSSPVCIHPRRGVEPSGCRSCGRPEQPERPGIFEHEQRNPPDLIYGGGD